MEMSHRSLLTLSEAWDTGAEMAGTVAQGWTILGWVTGLVGATGTGRTRGAGGAWPRDSSASAVVEVDGDNSGCLFSPL